MWCESGAVLATTHVCDVIDGSSNRADVEVCSRGASGNLERETGLGSLSENQRFRVSSSANGSLWSRVDWDREA